MAAEVHFTTEFSLICCTINEIDLKISKTFQGPVRNEYLYSVNKIVSALETPQLRYLIHIYGHTKVYFGPLAILGSKHFHACAHLNTIEEETFKNNK